MPPQNNPSGAEPQGRGETRGLTVRRPLRAASTMPATGYGAFWRAYFARQGVDIHGRPLPDTDDLERRVEELERELAEFREGRADG
jgi:hypothetical protein